MFGNSAGNLYQRLILQWRGSWMFGYKQVGIQPVALYNIIPALAEIELNICCCWSFDQSVSVVPWMWRGVPRWGDGVATKRCRVGMRVSVPAVKFAAWLDHGVNATNKGMGAIDNRDFLMEGFDRVMENTTRTIVQEAGHTYLGEFLMCCLRIIVGEDIFIAIPEQYPDFDAFAQRIAQDRLQRKRVSTPELNFCLR